MNVMVIVIRERFKSFKINSQKKIISFHDHNEKSIVKKLINKIKDGNTIALVSDAGTPCINDPGYTLVKFAREENIDVLPIPGASSIISALSVSGMPIDSFCYEGYLPAKSEKRKSKLMELIEFSFFDSEFLDQGINSEEKLRFDSGFVFWVDC